MARLQQQNPGNYRSSAAISAEFENLVRYLNAAERGNRTVGELLAQIFDSSGKWAGPVNFRFDPANGLEYRVGTYTNDAEGWQTLVQSGELRGAAGSNLGSTGTAALLAPLEFVATAGQTTFTINANPADGFLVYRNGVLQRPGASFDYQVTITTPGGLGPQNIVFNAAQTVGTRISISRVRSDPNQPLIRNDQFTAGAQSVFAYDPSLQNADIFVFRNGILQREGASFDYTRQTTQPTITFNTAVPINNLVSIVGLPTAAQVTVPGLMLERDFVDETTGGILWTRLNVADNQIPQSKVNGLATLNSSAARLHIGSSPPVDPALTRFWIDTSATPNSLKVWDGSTWLRTTVENLLPTTAAINAGQFLKVNALGSGYELGSVDLSSVIPRTWRGAANGVASLDADGRIPGSQMPAVFPADSIYFVQSGAVAGGVYQLKRIYGQRILITGVSARLAGGTATGRLTVAGIGVGPTFSLSASPVEQPLTTSIEVDASVVSRAIGFEITSPASANNLEVALACRLVL